MLTTFPKQSVFNKAPMELLKRYPLPHDRLSAGILEVTKILTEYSNHKYGECESGRHKGEKHLKNGSSARLSHAVFMVANCIFSYDRRLKGLYNRVKERHMKAGKPKGVAHLIANCAVAREVAMLIDNSLKDNRRYYQKKEDYKAYKLSLSQA